MTEREIVAQAITEDIAEWWEKEISRKPVTLARKADIYRIVLKRLEEGVDV